MNTVNIVKKVFIPLFILSIFISSYSSYSFAADNEQDAKSLIDKIEGVYKRRFNLETVQDEKCTAENILEIVPYEKDKIYFVIKSYFYNGHSCSVSGIAQYQEGKFTFSPSDKIDEQMCKLNISLKNGHIISIEDVDDMCRRYYCGTRGGLNDEDFTIAKRRKIKYMDKILNSSEYKEAINDFEKLKAKKPDANPTKQN